MNAAVLTSHVGATTELQSVRTQAVEEKKARETVSKRFSELKEQKTTIDASLREERLKSEQVAQENESLKVSLQAKREAKEAERQQAIEAEQQAQIIAVEEAPVATPAPSLAVAPQPVSAGGMEGIVRQAARNHGIDENHFVRIAMCESGMNPNAVNYGYFENGHPSGMFQHISGYWPGRAAQYGFAGASVFDPVANANVTAAMFANGHHNLWECR